MKRRCQYCEAPLPWFARLAGWHTCSWCAALKSKGGPPMTPEGRRRVRAALDEAKRDIERDPAWRGYGREVDQLWAAKQALAHPARYYGEGGTLHGTTELDVETHLGVVVAVWYRCQMLPFKQREVSFGRAAEMDAAEEAGLPKITGVEVLDQ